MCKNSHNQINHAKFLKEGFSSNDLLILFRNKSKSF